MPHIPYRRWRTSLRTHPHGSIVLTVVAALLVTACSGSDGKGAEDKLTPVVVQLRWMHQAQFAGMYAADQQGLYRRAGLDVQFVEGGQGKDVIAAVTSGQATFGVAGGLGVLQARADGEAIQAVAAIYRRSPEAFVTLRSSNIHGPQDFTGKRISREPGDVALLHAMTRAVGVDPSAYTEVDSADNIADLVAGRTDVINAFLMNEPDRLRAMGHEVSVFSPDDYGVHSYADVLVTTDDEITTNPATVRSFVEATVAGWQHAIDNPGDVAALVQRYNPEADAPHETRFMAISRPLINTGEDSIGVMRPAVWQEMSQLLQRENLTPPDFDPTAAYDTSFVTT